MLRMTIAFVGTIIPEKGTQLVFVGTLPSATPGGQFRDCSPVAQAAQFVTLAVAP